MAAQARDAARHADLGLVYSANGLWVDAGDAYSNALVLGSRDPLVWQYRGLAISRLARIEAAAESFRQAVARQPELASAHWHRGQLLRQTGRMTEAAELFQRAIQADPQEWRGYVGFGQALLQQGRKSEALAPLERAATLPFWHGRSWRLVIAIAPDGKWRSARARTCRRRWTRGRSGRAPIRLNTRIQLLQKPTKKTKGRHLCAGADRPAGETGRTCVESGFE